MATRLPPLRPQPQLKNNYWFVLGREPLLSIAEIFAKLNLTPDEMGGAKMYPPVGNPDILSVGKMLDPQKIMAELGGTIKIGRGLGGSYDEDELLKKITEELRTIDGKINFGVSVYGGQNNADKKRIEGWGRDIKHLLKNEGRSVRYIFKNEATLSSVTVSKNGLDKRGAEFLVCATAGGKFDLARTVAVQPFENFSERDYGRPGRDDTSGMLPPKLAMMMINISGADKEAVLLDPFCGSGTILTEAALLGHKNLVGMDVSERAIEDTKKNFDWLAQKTTNYKLQTTNYKLLKSDIADLSKKISAHSIDAIVTEPYLGPPLSGRETREQLEKSSEELAGLYLSAFRQFKMALKSDGTVVFIFPRFKGHTGWVTPSLKIMPEIKKLGFVAEPLLPNNLSREPHLLYYRPGQKVGREIWKFKLATN